MTSQPEPGGPGPSGPRLFARFAYPPNALGYCGPPSAPRLLELAADRAAAGTADEATDARLAGLARAFSGAWPYLEAIGAANGRDPLDAEVVEAYWLGNDLLASVRPDELRSLVETQLRQPASAWELVGPVLGGSAVAQHGFHVLAVYPWLGLLRRLGGGEALGVLDRCRIRWGEVVAVGRDTAEVASRPLLFDGRSLTLGEPRTETATVASDGLALAGELSAGDLVALHWDWVCDRISPDQAGRLEALTAGQLELANRALGGT